MKKLIKSLIAASICLSVTFTSFAAVTRMMNFYDIETEINYLFGTFDKGDKAAGFELDGKPYLLDEEEFKKAESGNRMFGIGFEDKNNYLKGTAFEVVPYALDSENNVVKGEPVTLYTKEGHRPAIKSIKVNGEEIYNGNNEYYVPLTDVSTLPTVTAESENGGTCVVLPLQGEQTIRVDVFSPSGINKKSYYIYYREIEYTYITPVSVLESLKNYGTLNAYRMRTFTETISDDIVQYQVYDIKKAYSEKKEIIKIESMIGDFSSSYHSDVIFYGYNLNNLDSLINSETGTITNKNAFSGYKGMSSDFVAGKALLSSNEYSKEVELDSSKIPVSENGFFALIGYKTYTAATASNATNLTNAKVKLSYYSIDDPLLSDATLKSISVDGKAISGFDPSKTEYYVGVSDEKKADLSVTAELNNPNAEIISIEKDESRRLYEIKVKAGDKVTINTYVIKYRLKKEITLTLSDSRYGYDYTSGSAGTSYTQTYITNVDKNGNVVSAMKNMIGYMLFNINDANPVILDATIKPGNNTSVTTYDYYQYTDNLSAAVTKSGDETSGYTYKLNASYIKGNADSGFIGFTDREEYELGSSVITERYVSQPTVSLLAHKIKASSEGYVILCLKNAVIGNTKCYYYNPTVKFTYVNGGDVLYTEDSLAELNSATPSCGELYPPFKKDVYEYYILSESFGSELPEISFTFKENSKVDYKKSSDINQPSEIIVTSPDGKATETYRFHYRPLQSAVLVSDKLNETELPLTNDADFRSLSSVTEPLSFNKSIFADKNSLIKDISLELWAKGKGNIEITDSGKNILGSSSVSSDDYEKILIAVDSDNFSDFNSLDFNISGNADIFLGKNGIETFNQVRVPVLKVSYYETHIPETVAKWFIPFSARNNYDSRPTDKYISEQNPPAFSMPYFENAISYDIIVASDEDMRNVLYSTSKNSINLYNFPCEFEPGTYFWSARFHTEDGVSDWAEPLRFTVRPDAYSAPMPSIDNISDKFAAMTHPRIIVNENTLEEFRALKDKSDYYSSIISTADAVVKSPVKGEPVYNGSNASTVKEKAEEIVAQIFDTAFAYILTGDEKYAKTGKDILLHVADWELDPDGSTAYKVQDQTYRTIVYNCAIGYDWLYNCMSETERAKVEDMLIKRAVYEENPAEGLKDSPCIIYKTPYVSHGWGHMGAVLTASIALADKNDTLKGFIEKYLPVYVAMSGTQWGYQDGAYANGYQYWTYFSEHSTIAPTLKAAGILDMSNTAHYKNSWLFGFYTTFNHSSMEFGDGSYSNGADTGSKYMIKMNMTVSDSPYAKWKYNSLDLPASGTTDGYYLAYNTDIQPKAPYDLPKSHLFKDSGYVAMHSDLINDSERISLYFRSSKYASKNHSHPDQNSFHIQAYGQRLAIDSGYYDSYHSAFDNGYTRKTYAHNAITINGGQGQPSDVIQASGKITNFISSDSFDLTGGDAIEAYNCYADKYGYAHKYEAAPFSKAERHIIYVRPDSFIIIDSLKAGENQEHNFEWWLNAYDDIEFYPDRNGARITRNNARLETEIVYPSDIKKGGLLDTFSGPDGTVYTPSGSYADMPVHKRVWFETEKTAETKIIAVMNVHKTPEEPKNIITESFDGYIKLTFENNTVCYINTKNDNSYVNADGYSFKGLALTVKGDSFMLTDGTTISKNGESLFVSDKTVSVAFENNRLHLSSLNDVSAKIRTDRVYRITDGKGNIITDEDIGFGISGSYSEGWFEVDALSGFHTLCLTTANSSLIPVTKY